MTYELYRTIFIAAGIGCILMLLLCVFLFFFLKIPRVIGDLSGSTRKKEIQKIREHSRIYSGKRPYQPFQPSLVMQRRTRLSERLSYSRSPILQKQLPTLETQEKQASASLQAEAFAPAQTPQPVHPAAKSVSIPCRRPAPAPVLTGGTATPAQETTVLPGIQAAAYSQSAIPAPETTVLPGVQPAVYGQPAHMPAPETTVLPGMQPPAYGQPSETSTPETTVLPGIQAAAYSRPAHMPTPETTVLPGMQPAAYDRPGETSAPETTVLALQDEHENKNQPFVESQIAFTKSKEIIE